MTGAAVFTLLLIGLLAWMLWGGKRPGRQAERRTADEDKELEAAEREVAELESGHDPDEGWAGSDWGPGAPRPPRS